MIFEAANKFDKNGFSILPTKPDKSPHINKWKGVDIPLSEFKKDVGIGVKCGAASLGLECLDFDNHFGDAKQVISDYLNQPQVKEIYDKYKLPVESTMSGGFHLLFRSSNPTGNQKLASRARYDEKLKRFKPDAIIETRGEGGYFVVAPSKGYKVIRNDIYNVQEIDLDERNILIETAKSFNQWYDPKQNEYEDNNKPGNVYNSKSESIDEMKSALLRAGWTELNKYQWRRPNKNKGISATIGKVADNVFYCFTSSGFPFEMGSGYTPFQVVGLLDYNGDFKKFAKDLANRYDLAKYENNKVPYKKDEKQKKTEKELDDIIAKTYIDVNIPIEKPPVILEINHGNKVDRDFKRLMTLGNISTITGKGKSKKTFLSSMLLACFSSNDILNHKFKSDLPSNKRIVLHFDTEQSEYDSWIVAKRIHDLSGGYKQHLGTFCLREYEPQDRVDIIHKTIEKWKDQIGFIMIDGVADLITDINAVEDSVKITTMLMAWTKKYNTHICTIIHQNKNDNYATGHLGSALIKKSEVVIGVEKDSMDKFSSIVSCQNIRGAQDFEDFVFYINEYGQPKINWNPPPIKGTLY